MYPYVAEPFLPVYGIRFAINCPSHVCLYLYFRATTTSLVEALIMVVSIAIWNRKKLAVWISLGVWGCNVAFLIQGKSLLCNCNRSGNPCLTRFGTRCCAGEIFNLNYFGLCGLIR